MASPAGRDRADGGRGPGGRADRPAAAAQLRPAAVRAAAAAPARLGGRLAAAANPADVAELLDPLPVDAALVVAADGGPGARPAELYLERLRGSGSRSTAPCCAKLGLAQSPRVGEVLAELLRRKRNGQLADRRSEIAAARELVARAAS